MEIENLEGTIIGIIPDVIKMPDDYHDELVKDIITKKTEDSLKMVNLPNDILDKPFSSLSFMAQNKVRLAQKLQDKTIVLYDFAKGMTQKEINYFKRFFKKIASYGKKIILVSRNVDLFLNCVDNVYISSGEDITYHTTDVFDPTLYIETDNPEIVNFIYKCQDLGVHLDEYTELNELIKAIYRIKS